MAGAASVPVESSAGAVLEFEKKKKKGQREPCRVSDQARAQPAPPKQPTVAGHLGARSGIRLVLGTAGYDQWRGAAVGMALATRYFA
jgi:hypothetical protein